MIKKKIICMFLNLFSLLGLSINMQVINDECSNYIMINNVGLFQLSTMGFVASALLMFFIIMESGEV